MLDGVVRNVESYGAFVEIADEPGIFGLVHKTEVSWEFVANVDEALSKGVCVCYVDAMCVCPCN